LPCFSFRERGFEVAKTPINIGVAPLAFQPAVFAVAAQRICSVADKRVIVDADTAYGNAINMIRTGEDLIRAGAGGMFLEVPSFFPERGLSRSMLISPLKRIAAATVEVQACTSRKRIFWWPAPVIESFEGVTQRSLHYVDPSRS
jgi:hypothetical protein